MKSKVYRWRYFKETMLHIPAVSISLIIVAVASLSFAAYAAKDFTHAARTAAALAAETPRGELLRVVKQPVSPAEVSDLMQLLKLNHPSLEVAQSAVPGGLVISGSSTDQYREWVTALGTIQGASRPGSVNAARSVLAFF